MYNIMLVRRMQIFDRDSLLPLPVDICNRSSFALLKHIDVFLVALTHGGMSRQNNTLVAVASLSMRLAGKYMQPYCVLKAHTNSRSVS
jgi:hypothetical protein